MKRVITININSLIDRLEIKNTTDSAENTKAFNEIEQKVMESLSRIIYNASNADLQERAPKANSIEVTINEMMESCKGQFSMEIETDFLAVILKEYKRLKHHEASTIGLWAIDRKPNKVSYKWILKEAFRIKRLDTCL